MPRSTRPSGRTGWPATDRFGMLAVNNLDPPRRRWCCPPTSPLAGDELLMHLARPNPVWPHLEAADRGTAGRGRRLRLHPDVLAGQGRRARRGRRADQLLRRRAVRLPANRCRRPRRARSTSSPPSSPTSNPKAGHATVAVDAAPYGRMLSGIRGVRLTVLQVEAKFKYDDHNPVEHRQRVIDNLEQRGHGLDAGAAAQQRRRLDRDR